MAKGGAATDLVLRLARENAVVIFSQRACYFCHAVKQLFSGMAVTPMVYELDEYPRGKELERALMRLLGGGGAAVPVVFVGGKLVGGIERVIGSPNNGTLVPLLKEAGALWL